MLPLPDERMNINKFVDVKLPTKAQIFARTGERAVTPNGVYTKDDPARFGHTQTEQMNDFTNAVEDLPAADEQA